jgi:hypothetical protein
LSDLPVACILGIVDGWVGGLCPSRKLFVDFQAFVLQVVVPEEVRPGVLEGAIQAFVACRNETAKPIQWMYTFEKLKHKLGAT